jgi:hypothetical protein
MKEEKKRTFVLRFYFYLHREPQQIFQRARHLNSKCLSETSTCWLADLREQSICARTRVCVCIRMANMYVCANIILEERESVCVSKTKTDIE